MPDSSFSTTFGLIIIICLFAQIGIYNMEVLYAIVYYI